MLVLVTLVVMLYFVEGKDSETLDFSSLTRCVTVDRLSSESELPKGSFRFEN